MHTSLSCSRSSTLGADNQIRALSPFSLRDDQHTPHQALLLALQREGQWVVSYHVCVCSEYTQFIVTSAKGAHVYPSLCDGCPQTLPAELQWFDCSVQPFHQTVDVLVFSIPRRAHISENTPDSKVPECNDIGTPKRATNSFTKFQQP